jgi:hypothetical protein
MPTSSPRLGDYRDKLTVGTILGLSYVIHDHGYNKDRALPIQQLTVDCVRDDTVVFHKAGGHELRLPLHQVLTYLRFGRGPYQPKDNILNVSL